jgi:hypothetical protein
MTQSIGSRIPTLNPAHLCAPCHIAGVLTSSRGKSAPQDIRLRQVCNRGRNYPLSTLGNWSSLDSELSRVHTGPESKSTISSCYSAPTHMPRCALQARHPVSRLRIRDQPSCPLYLGRASPRVFGSTQRQRQVHPGVVCFGPSLRPCLRRRSWHATQNGSLSCPHLANLSRQNSASSFPPGPSYRCLEHALDGSCASFSPTRAIFRLLPTIWQLE